MAASKKQVAHDWSRANALGLNITGPIGERLDGMIATANGRRRERLVNGNDVLEALGDALNSEHGLGIRHGGVEFTGKTSLVFAVRLDAAVVVGVASCSADKPTPGRAWSRVRPWQQDYSRNLSKAHAWAEEQDVDRVRIERSEPAASPGVKPKSNGEQLLQRILQHHDDDEARLVYADWLSEQGDPRGEFIRLQLALDSAKSTDRTKLESACNALLKKHRRAWLKDAAQVSDTVELRRGFVWSIQTSPQAFANGAGALMQREPVNTLMLVDSSARSIHKLAETEHLAKLERVEFLEPFYLKTPKEVAALKALLKSPHLGQVRHVRIVADHARFTTHKPDMSDLMQDVNLPSVQTLLLRISCAPADAYLGLTNAVLPSLEKLALGTNDKGVLGKLQQALPNVKFGRLR